MATIAENLQTIIDSKAAIKDAIEAKGVAVGDAPLTQYASKIGEIQQGGTGFTGTVDTAGLTELGWDSQDIQWLQDHVWWNAEDDSYWAVSEENKAFGPNGATPLTWTTREEVKSNKEVRYLPKLSLPNNITTLASAFNGYIFLYAIPTHGWNLSTVTRFDQAFRNTYNLRSLGDTSYFVTSATTRLDLMFGDSYSLSAIDVSHWDTCNVTTFGSCFNGTAIEEIDISGFSFAKATSVASMFLNCSSLRSIKFPTSINAPVLTTVNAWLQNSTSLEDVTINLTAPLLTNASNVVAGCYSLNNFKLNVSAASITTFTLVCNACRTLLSIDFTGIDTTSCNQASMGSSITQSAFSGTCFVQTIKLGANFFNGTFTTLYATNSYSWTRDSIYESLYTNQTSRNSNSSAVTVKLATNAYDGLSQQDISDIASKNITLTRG